MIYEKLTPLKATLTFTVFGFLFMLSAVLIGKYAGQSFVQSPPHFSHPAEAVINEASSDKALTDTSDAPPEGADVNCRVIMIDPGHGGEDGGAVAASGILEKDLNLAVSCDVADLCVIFGIPYSMTRTEDKLLYGIYNEFTDYTGKKKSLDLKNRLKLTEEIGADLFLSIHMNSFTDPRYQRLQVYYSAGREESRQIAEVVQLYVKNHLQPHNERQAKMATSSIYLLKNIEIPAILVECGFMSNDDEVVKLSSPQYRASLAASIFTPVCEYFVRS